MTTSTNMTLNLMPKKFSSFLVIIFLTLFFYWLFIDVKNQTPKPQPLITNNSQLITISGQAQITDGDSIKIDGKRIRLLGIDAPESAQKCFNQKNQEYFCGQVSTAFLKQLIKTQKVTCNSPEKDIYNRYLAECFLGEININHEMIKNGMAIIYNLKTASAQLKEMENAAKNQKLGLWQGAFEEPKSFRKRNK